MYILIGLFVLVIFIIILFSFPKFSPIPYFPSNMKDRDIILKGLGLKNDQVIIDLGAGDGVVVFNAAYESMKSKLNTKFIALEINPVLVLILHVRRLFHPNRKSITVVWGDMFKINYFQLLSTIFNYFKLTPTFYLYISPWLIEQVITRIKKQIPKAKFVSYYYPIKSLNKYEKTFRGIHNLFVYANTRL